MIRNEIEQRILYEVKEIISGMNTRELVNILADPLLSSHPEIYIDYLPEGLKFVSLAKAKNCHDFAQGCHGITFLPATLYKGTGRSGDLVLYYNRVLRCTHSGILIADGRVRSQWNIGGAVFEHNLLQVPDSFGQHYEYCVSPIRPSR